MLHVFRTLCQDPRGLLELFINYDMVDGRTELFQSVLAALSSIAQGFVSDDFKASQTSPLEAADLRFLAMQGVVMVTRSLSTIVDAGSAPVDGGEGEAGGGDDAGTSGGAGASGRDTGGSREEPDEEPLSIPSPIGPSGIAAASLSATPSGTPADGAVGSPGLAGLSLVETYDQRKRQKEEVTRAAIRFKSKPRDGIAHLVRVGKCEDTPESIAAVFHELQDVLDKTVIGDYMGGEKELNVKV